MRSCIKSCVCALSISAMAMASGGCVALRPRDDQRTEIAQRAAAAAQELRETEVSPFGAMESNVQTVDDAWEQLIAIQTQDRQDTFYADLGNMTRADVRQELALAVQLHLFALKNARAAAATAAADVQAQLDRQVKIQQLVDEAPGGRLPDVLQNLEKRLDWIHDLQVNISRALALKAQLEGAEAAADGGEGSAGSASKSLPQAAADALDHVRTFLSEVNTNPQVAASTELLLRAGQEVTDIERQRLGDMHLYLSDVRRLLDDLEDRQGDYFRFLALPAFSAVLNSEEFWPALANVEKALDATCEGEFDPFEPLDLPLLSDSAQPAKPRRTPAEVVVCLIQDIRADEEAQDDALARMQALWEGREDDGGEDGDSETEGGDSGAEGTGSEEGAAEPRTLRAFIEESLKRTESPDPTFAAPAVVAARLLPQLAVMLFVEEPADERAELEIARQEHLHSIRQSQINADERLALVEQLAQALQLYYQGGVSPAELAQAIMLGSQVLATYFIGSRL